MWLVMRRITSQLPVLSATVLVLALTAGAVAGAARVVVQMTADGLHQSLRETTLAGRGLTARRQLVRPDLAMARIDADGRRLRDELEPAVRAVTSPANVIVDTPRFVVADPVLSGRSRIVTMRAQSGVIDRDRLHDGRLPRRTDDRVPVPALLRETAFGRGQPDAVVIEVAVTRQTAEALRVDVDDTVILDADQTDPYAGSVLSARPFIAARVVGIVTLDDPDEPVWFGNTAAHVPTQITDPGGNSVTVYATALTAVDALGDLASAIAPLPLVPAWRYGVEPTAVEADALDKLQAALRRIEQRFVTSAFVPPERTGVRTSLGQVLGDFVAARNATLRTMAVAATGLAAVLAMVVALLAALRASSRYPLDLMLRARGASAAQVVGADAIELGAAAALAAAAGVIASTAVGQPAEHATWTAAAATGVVAAVLLTVAHARRHAAGGARADRPSPRRLVAEAAVIGVAVVATVVARRRGVVASDGGAVLLAVPALIGLAVGVALARALPAAAGALVTTTIGRGSLVVATGLRRLARAPSATVLPVLAVTLAAATLVLTASVAGSVTSALDVQAWQQVGAPARLDGHRVATATTASPAAVSAGAPADAGVPAFIRRRVPVEGERATVLAVEPRGYEHLVAGTPIATELSSLRERGGGPRERSEPLPAITSDAIGPVGAQRTLSLPGQAVVHLEVLETRTRFPSLSPDAPFIVVSLPDLAARVPAVVTPNRWYLPAVDTIGEGAILTQAGAVADLRAAPLPAAGLTVFRASALSACGLAVVAVGVSLALGAPARRLDVAYLRAIGLSRQQAWALLTTEVLPALLVALIVGVALGIGVVVLLGAGLQLVTLTGETATTARVDVSATVVWTGALGFVITLVTAISGWRTRDVDVSQALRMEDAS